MMDAADRALFEQSLRHATATHTGAALDSALADLGWLDALAVDPRTAVSLHFELQGRAGAASSALGHVVAHALGVDEPTAIVLPALGTWSPPGRSLGGALLVDGIGTTGSTDADHVLVATAVSGEGAGAGDVVLGAVPTGALTTQVQLGLDPDLGLVRVTGEVTDPIAPTARGEWADAVDLARLAIAHELVGAARTMLDLARTHALERVQFGQPIAAFQAVRHRLAESLVAVEAADALLDAAWLEATPEAAAMAKSVAGRGARTVARHAQQVLAGIGFTTEHPFHRSLRRVLVLDQLFGSARALTADLGAGVLERGQLPPLLAL